MLKKLKLLLILFTITFNILSMDKATSSSTASSSNQDQTVNQEKALACTKLLPDLQNLIAQYASNGWYVHKIIEAHRKDITSLSISNDGKLLDSSSLDGLSKTWDTDQSDGLQYHYCAGTSILNNSYWKERNHDNDDDGINLSQISNSKKFHIANSSIKFHPECSVYNTEIQISRFEDGITVSRRNLFPWQNRKANAFCFSTNDKFLAVGLQNDNPDEF